MGDSYLYLEKVLGWAVDLVEALLSRVGHGLQDGPVVVARRRRRPAGGLVGWGGGHCFSLERFRGVLSEGPRGSCLLSLGSSFSFDGRSAPVEAGAQVARAQGTGRTWRRDMWDEKLSWSGQRSCGSRADGSVPWVLWWWSGDEVESMLVGFYLLVDIRSGSGTRGLTTTGERWSRGEPHPSLVQRSA